jgi:hypothetical protein
MPQVIALVTGASRGLGKGIALALGEAGGEQPGQPGGHLWKALCQPVGLGFFDFQWFSREGCLRRSRPSLARPVVGE